MLFNSYEFLFLFLPVVLALWYGLAGARKTDAAVASLVVASCAFYAWWNWRFLPLLGLSVAFNYAIGRRLGERPDKRLLAAGIAANLLVLAYFTYANFLLDTAHQLTGAAVPHLDVVLPLGISFITFQKIAFLVDSYKGHARGYRLRDFLLFVTFFPQLIAGPIVHHGQFIPQLQRLRIFVVDHRHLALGAFLFACGLFKKVAIADSLAPWVAPAFDQATTVGFLDAWAAALAYTFQLYYDFSGYSEMALGLALLFNLKLPLNFDSPYQATSIIEFWRRWHMTLSAFLREYVYIALGGNRHGPVRRYVNLVATMLIGGLWHGAAWTFVFWGALHGAYLVLNHGFRAVADRLPSLGLAGPWAARALTFLAVVVGWVFFRAPDFAAAGKVLAGMAGLSGFASANLAHSASGLLAREQLLVLAALLGWAWLAPNAPAVAERLRPGFAWALATAGLLLAALLVLDRPSAFIYYQF